MGRRRIERDRAFAGREQPADDPRADAAERAEDAHERTIMPLVFQSERFFREAWPQISQSVESTDAASDVQWIAGVTALDSGASVLDAPCGFGRHSVEFA